MTPATPRPVSRGWTVLWILLIGTFLLVSLAWPARADRLSATASRTDTFGVPCRGEVAVDRRRQRRRRGDGRAVVLGHRRRDREGGRRGQGEGDPRPDEDLLREPRGRALARDARARRHALPRRPPDAAARVGRRRAALAGGGALPRDAPRRGEPRGLARERRGEDLRAGRRPGADDGERARRRFRGEAGRDAEDGERLRRRGARRPAARRRRSSRRP